jgi:hypothetical protein
VRSEPVQMESLCISECRALFVVVAFLCWTAERLTRVVIHFVIDMYVLMRFIAVEQLDLLAEA